MTSKSINLFLTDGTPTNSLSGTACCFTKMVNHQKDTEYNCKDAKE